jgi:hypothetical protein
MKKTVLATLMAFSSVVIFGTSALAAGSTPITTLCAPDLFERIPARALTAESGSGFVKDIFRLRGADRDARILEQVMAGNVPKFLRHLMPVTLSWTPKNGKKVDVTICVTPDYMAVGGDRDFVRVPMGLPTAARIAARLGFMLPTTKMVDAIYALALVHLTPAPMTPGAQMESTDYFTRHNLTVNQQRDGTGYALSALTAGQKKDLVLSNRLRTMPGRVAIYGWHRTNGKPIQPLSTVHGQGYADYSHGIRLISATAFVNGKPRALADILQDPGISAAVSSEGPITLSNQLLASLQ